MNPTIADILRFVLSVGALAIIIFVLGALVGWRWSVPRERHEPIWMYLLGQAAWLMLIGAQLLAAPIPGMEWLQWLPPIVLVLSVIAFVMQLRARRVSGLARRSPPGGSGSYEAS